MQDLPQRRAIDGYRRLAIAVIDQAMLDLWSDEVGVDQSLAAAAFLCGRSDLIRAHWFEILSWPEVIRLAPEFQQRVELLLKRRHTGDLGVARAYAVHGLTS